MFCESKNIFKKQKKCQLSTESEWKLTKLSYLVTSFDGPFCSSAKSLTNAQFCKACSNNKVIVANNLATRYHLYQIFKSIYVW